MSFVWYEYLSEDAAFPSVEVDFLNGFYAFLELFRMFESITSAVLLWMLRFAAAMCMEFVRAISCMRTLSLGESLDFWKRVSGSV